MLLYCYRTLTCIEKINVVTSSFLENLCLRILFLEKIHVDASSLHSGRVEQQVVSSLSTEFKGTVTKFDDDGHDASGVVERKVDGNILVRQVLSLPPSGHSKPLLCTITSDDPNARYAGIPSSSTAA